MKVNFLELPGMVIHRAKVVPDLNILDQPKKAKGFRVQFQSKISVVGPTEDKRVR